uniref:Uncharacterized protein n=1 Tax=Nelumbo nucifera TaxID=4432 RepID=A0A822YM82_NELNU|nr:TPA_asm: hypothetical protein HUJ06_011260 [Nelumbo nucifera]
MQGKIKEFLLCSCLIPAISFIISGTQIQVFSFGGEKI